MRMRCLEGLEDRERMYQDEVIAAYLRRYETLSKHMVNNYKMQLVTSFVTEQYCNEGAQKYSGKHKDLIEKALYSG